MRIGMVIVEIVEAEEKEENQTSSSLDS